MLKPFIQIARPHKDVFKGEPTMDIYAADLWQVFKGSAPLDYQDPEIFFKKTYLTKNLDNIIKTVNARLDGKSGDSTIQLQTPFGGGKTHTLIALYHKAKEWNVKVVVFVGSALHPEEVRPWEELERQLTGNVKITKGYIAPGTDKLTKLISDNAPVLILMDEVLEYVIKAAGIKVGDSNLGAQTVAFIQELSGVTAAVGKSLLVITLPSSMLERYDDNAEKARMQLQKVIGRTEKIYTPVEDDEIGHVIRARLFSSINEKEVKEVVDEFVEYAVKEGLLTDEEKVNYRERFLSSYPFKPEVIDVLYKRWGSSPSFQRTRGVLRLLSLVIYNLLNKNIPFIRIGDFDLSDDKIKMELIKHIGNEWSSIIAEDITSREANAKKVDESIGSSYRPYSLGTVTATTIFMSSFPQREEKGPPLKPSLKEIKLSVVYPELPSSIIDTVINDLKGKLFYLSDEGLYFINKSNLNRIIITREESIGENELLEKEKSMIREYISKDREFEVYLYPERSRDIPDTQSLKLIITNKKPNPEFLEMSGEKRRVYRNTLIFLSVDNDLKGTFYLYLRRLTALEYIKNSELMLTDAQKKEVENKLRDAKNRKYEELRRYYCKLFLPAKDNFEEINMGLPTFREYYYIDKEIYEFLTSKEKVLKSLDPIVIRDRYLAGKDYLRLKELYETFLNTPGEIRLKQEAYIESIRKGVENGLFGIGYINNGKIECKYIKERPTINFNDDEIIIKAELCIPKKEEVSIPSPQPTSPSLGYEKREIEIIQPEKRTEVNKYSRMYLRLGIPSGQLSQIARLLTNYLNKQFSSCEVEVIIKATNGEIRKEDYEDKIKEMIRQSNIEIKEEHLE